MDKDGASVSGKAETYKDIYSDATTEVPVGGKGASKVCQRFDIAHVCVCMLAV